MTRELAALRLRCAPVQAIAHPVDACERAEIGGGAARGVGVIEPRHRDVDADGGILRSRFAERLEHAEGDAIAVAVEQFEITNW